MTSASQPETGAIQQLGSAGDGAEIRPPFPLEGADRVTIGARCSATFGLVALGGGSLTIGDDVHIGPHVQLFTSAPSGGGEHRPEQDALDGIVIGDNVWLGGRVVVLPGVTIGHNTIVAAGAVVSSDLPPDVVASGDPARIVRTLSTGRDEPLVS